MNHLKAPPGLHITTKFPVLTYGSTPRVEPDIWRFKIFGAVKESVTFTWKGFLALGNLVISAEFHCVTQWSRLNNIWKGVPFHDVSKAAKPTPDARLVLVHSYGGYTTNIALSALMDNDVLFAYNHDGKPLEPDHGGPMRLVVPKRYGWKSAKWVNRLEFLSTDTPGFWEDRGYHMEGDPWKTQRFQ